MLRSPEWIADYGAHVGGTVWLNMPEMGVEGEAEVLDIGPAQVYDVRPGLVTGTFRHTSGEVYDLKLESETKPIGVTGTHPFWSVSREAWVSVLDLEIGETLKTLEGTTVVESRVRRPEPEPVYNIEVEGDHCYRVGESGVLVHNASEFAEGVCCAMHQPVLTDEVLFQRAIAARDARLEEIQALSNTQRNRISTVVGCVNVVTGVAAYGEKRSGENEGKCAEDLCVEALGVDKAQIFFSSTIRPRTSATIPVCPRCQTKFCKDQFSPGTPFDSCD